MSKLKYEKTSHYSWYATAHEINGQVQICEFYTGFQTVLTIDGNELYEIGIFNTLTEAKNAVAKKVKEMKNET